MADDFDTFFEKIYSRIVRDIDYVVGDRTLAVELAQEAFIKAYERWADVCELSSPRAWVRTVGIRMGLRAQARSRKEHGLLIATSSPDAVDVVERPSVIRMDVRTAILQLPAVQRAVVVLFYFDDLGTKDIADVLSCGPSTVGVHLHNARQRLGVLLADYKR